MPYSEEICMIKKSTLNTNIQMFYIRDLLTMTKFINLYAWLSRPDIDRRLSSEAVMESHKYHWPDHNH